MAKKRETTRKTVEDLDDSGNVVATLKDVEEIHTLIKDDTHNLRATVVSKIDHVARSTTTHIEYSPVNDKPAKFKRMKQEHILNDWQGSIMNEFASIKTTNEALFSGGA